MTNIGFNWTHRKRQNKVECGVKLAEGVQNWIGHLLQLSYRT